MMSVSDNLDTHDNWVVIQSKGSLGVEPVELVTVVVNGTRRPSLKAPSQRVSTSNGYDTLPDD